MLFLALLNKTCFGTMIAFDGHAIKAHVVWKAHPALSPKNMAAAVGSQKLRFSVATGLVPTGGVGCPFSLARVTREGSFSLSTSSPVPNSASDGRGVPETS